MKKLMLSAAVAFAIGFVATAEVVTSGKNVTVTGTGNTLSVTETEVQVDVQKDAALTVTPGQSFVIHGDNAAITTDIDAGDNWQEKVIFWLDASKPESLGYERAGDDPSGDVKYVKGKDGKWYPAINRWFDRRGQDQTYFALNNRGTAYMSDKCYTAVMPYVSTNETTGLPYVNFYNNGGSPRRIEFFKTADAAAAAANDGTKRANIPYKFAAVVFGSQDGGGAALVWYCTRGGYTGTSQVFTKDDPIFGTAYPTWVDGASVDPTTTGFDGDWQVVTFGGGSYGFTTAALTWSYQNNGSGYSEVILLSTLPTEAEKRNIEEYLQQKWSTKQLAPHIPSAEMRLFGTGTLSVPKGAVALGGEFAGNVTVAEGARLVLTDTQVAPTAPADLGTKADALHYDPNLHGTISAYGSAPNPNSVGWHYEERDQYSQVHGWYGSSRTPTWAEEARGFGSTNTWFSHDSTKTLNQVGCTLRMGPGDTPTGTTFGFKTGFMVLDTSAGGGTPFLGESIYAESHYLNGRSSETYPIYSVGVEAEQWVHRGTVRLNGIDGGKGEEKHFNSRPELFTASFTESFPLRCIGWYANTSAANMLIHGESIFYARELTDAERNDTEAYLMKRWLGITPKGYGDPSATTIDGAGTVYLANRAEHPKFAATFTGTVDAPCGTLAFALAKDAQGNTVVANPIKAAAITSLPSAVTVKLSQSFAGNPNGGYYTLIEGDGVAETTFTLDLSGVPENQRKRYSLEKDGDKLVLKAEVYGLTILIK